jgi:hypothetical protein
MPPHGQEQCLPILLHTIRRCRENKVYSCYGLYDSGDEHGAPRSRHNSIGKRSPRLLNHKIGNCSTLILYKVTHSLEKLAQLSQLHNSIVFRLLYTSPVHFLSTLNRNVVIE